MTAGPTPHAAARSGGVLPGGSARPMSVEAMRSAVIAIRGGAFDGVPATDGAPLPLTAPAAVPHLLAGDCGVPAVVVLATHAGAGASTVALAVAEALSGHRQVQLVEYADPRRSGLDTASSRELGLDESGWRRGRRGRIDVARLAVDHQSADCFPLPPPAGTGASDGDRVLVIDAGWPVISMMSGSGWASALPGVAHLVVVSRVTVPAVRQTEHVLGSLEVPAVLACVGAGRWPGMVIASCGPALRAARASGRVVTVPIDRRLAITGLTPDPLPKSVAAAGRTLAAELTLDRSLPGPSVTAPKELADVAGAER